MEYGGAVDAGSLQGAHQHHASLLSTSCCGKFVGFDALYLKRVDGAHVANCATQLL